MGGWLRVLAAREWRVRRQCLRSGAGRSKPAEGVFEEAGREAKGTGSAFEGDAAASADQVEAVGPGGVGALDAVLDGVEQRRNADAEIADAGGGGGLAPGVGDGRGEEDAVFHVRGELPEVGGMGLLDVDDVKGDAILMGVVKPVERGNLPAKRRSSVAAEDEDDGAFAPLIGESYFGAMVEGGEGEVPGGVVEVEAACAGVHPKGLEGQDHHGRQGHVRHDGSEALRGLAHGEVEAGGGGEVDGSEAEKDAADEFAAHAGSQ